MAGFRAVHNAKADPACTQLPGWTNKYGVDQGGFAPLIGEYCTHAIILMWL